jgi:hypothetical protein
MRNLDPILDTLLGDLVQLGRFLLLFSVLGVVPALVIAMVAGAANERPSRWRDVPSGAFWGLLAGVPVWVVTFLILLGCLQIVGALTHEFLALVVLAVSAVAGVFTAYRASAWYFRRKAEELWGWAIDYPTKPPQPANRWVSFSLQRLFIVQFVLIFVIGLWVGARRDHIARLYRYRAEAAERQAYQESLQTRFAGFGWHVFSNSPRRLNLAQYDGTKLVNFDDAILKRIEPFDHLQRITIHSDAMTDTGLEILSQHSELEYVRIESSQVTDAGIAHLEKLSQLQTVILTCPQLTAQALDHLQTIKSLKRVSLYKSTIPPQRTRDFKSARLEVRVEVFQ